MADMSTREAADRLGVSQRQVQRLVERGSLTGSWTVGHTLLVDPLSVSAMQRQSVSRGRPWSAAVTWGALWMLSGLHASWLTESQRSRTSIRLKTLKPQALVDATRQRAQVNRYRGAPTAVDQAHRFLALTGDGTSDAFLQGLSGLKTADGYCTSTVERSFVDKYELVPDRQGNITVRVPSYERVLDDRSEMPSAVIAVDLASSNEPRNRSTGLRMLEDLLE